MTSLTLQSAPVTLKKTGIAWPSDISKKFIRSSLLCLCHHCFPAIFLQFLDVFAHVHPSKPNSSNPNRITLTFPSQPQHKLSIGFHFREYLLRSIRLETSSSSSSSSTCITGKTICIRAAKQSMTSSLSSEPPPPAAAAAARPPKARRPSRPSPTWFSTYTRPACPLTSSTTQAAQRRLPPRPRPPPLPFPYPSASRTRALTF